MTKNIQNKIHQTTMKMVDTISSLTKEINSSMAFLTCSKHANLNIINLKTYTIFTSRQHSINGFLNSQPTVRLFM